MKSVLVTLACLVAVSVGFADRAAAQGPSLERSRKPALSPYLDLLNRRNSLEFNYYRRFRPFREAERFEQQTRERAREFRSQLDRQQQEFRDLERRSNLTPTGVGGATHLRYFGNHRRYFGAGGAAGR